MSHYLCKELIDAILGRLPPKSLVRFRSVSKSWYSHISSSGFIRKHALLSAKTPQKVILRQRIRFKKDGFEGLNTLHRENGVKISLTNFNIFGSCNGIICLVEKEHRRSISMWNLSIGRKLCVPYPPNVRITLGFGFDPITDDLKIVSIPYPKDEVLAHKSYVHSMKTNAWSEIAFPTTATYSHVKALSFAVLINGALHWTVKYDPANKVHCHIMTFDLSTNVFGKIPLPLRPNWVSLYLTVVKGFLALISTEDNNTWIRVWRENNNVASWSKAFNLTSLRYQGIDNLFCLKSFAENFETYNPAMGILSTLESFSDSTYIVYKDM